MLNTTEDGAEDVSAEKPEAIVISNDRDDDVSDHHEDDFKLGKGEASLDTKVSNNTWEACQAHLKARFNERGHPCD